MGRRLAFVATVAVALAAMGFGCETDDGADPAGMLAGSSGIGGEGGTGSSAGGSGGADDHGGRGGTEAQGGAEDAGGDGGTNAGAAGASAGDGGANAGTAGASGSGGEPGCPADDPLSCDDDDGCTLDFLDEVSCACAHDPLPDGSACDDGDVCTRDDRCVTGVCAGDARTSTPRALGQVRSVGSELGLSTLVAFVTDDRLVFATGSTLTLVGIDGDRLDVLDRIETNLRVQQDFVSAILGVLRPRTFLIALEGPRLAVASKAEGIEVYDVRDDRLALASRYPLEPGQEGTFNVATGTADRLWTCFGSTLRRYAVAEATAIVTLEASFVLPGNHSCQGLSLAPDGRTLLVATSEGLDRLDISSPDGTMTLLDSSFDGQFLLDVATSENHVVLYEIKDNNSGYGDVIVLDAETLATEQIVPIDLAGSSPVGFALTESRLVLLQRDFRDGATYTADFFAFGSNDLELSHSWPFIRTAEPVASSFPRHPVARGDYVVLEPTHQVVRLHADTGGLTLLGDPHQGSFERVLAAGPSQVAVHGRTSTHRIDISDPSLPTIEAGGLLTPLETAFLRLDVSDPSSVRFLTALNQSTQPNAGDAITFFQTDPVGAPRPIASVAVSDVGDNEWMASGEFVYQVTATGSLDLEIRRFRASRLLGAAPESPTPDFQQTLTPDAPGDTPARSSGLGIVSTVKLAVDSGTGALFALDRRSSGELFSGFSLEADGYVPAFSRMESGTIDIAAARGRVLVLHADRAQLVDGSGAVLAAVSLDDRQCAGRRLLGFDARRVYLDVRFQGEAPGPGVLVLRADDLTEISRYPTTEAVLSSAEVGEHLVFGTGSRLIVADPACTAD